MVHVTTAAAGSVDANYGNLDTYEALTGHSTLQFAGRAVQNARTLTAWPLRLHRGEY